MSYSTAAAATYLDLPGFVSRNILTRATSSKWHTAANGSDDVSDTDAPSSWLTDGYGHKPSKPTGSPATTWYHRWITTDFDADDEAEVIAILNHNLGDPVGGCTVVVETASDDAFTTPVTVHSFGAILTNARAVAFPSTIYSSLDRVRLKLTSSNAFVPQIGEVWMGSFSQLSKNTRRPADNLQMRGDVTTHRTKGAVETNYRRFGGQGIKPLSMVTQSSTDLAYLRQVYRDTEYGTRSCLFLQYPNSAPWYAYAVKVPAECNLPNVGGPAQRRVEWELREQPPFFERERDQFSSGLVG